MRSITAGALTALATLAAAGPASAQAQGADSTCVLALTKFDAATVNAAYPDEAAQYWVGAYQAAPGTRIRIDGEFPHARYMSFNVYDQAQRPIDAIADARIVPDEGSTNPFVVGARRTAKERSYSAFIDFGAKPAAGKRAPNTIYTGSGQKVGDVTPPNVNGTFIYRVYIPDAGRDETGDVGLPTVTLQSANGGRAPKSACRTFSRPAAPGLTEAIAGSEANVPVPKISSRNPTFWRKFTNPLDTYARVFNVHSDDTRRLGGSGGFLSNVDNDYLVGVIHQDFGKVLAVRVRAPTFPDTRDGARKMPGGQLRYFSMCQNERFSQRFIACRSDDQSAVGDDGFITYVISTPANRPATATARCGATWLPWGPSKEGVLLYRHMLADPGFGQAIQFADADRERETMGDYHPESTYYADAVAYDAQVGCRNG